MAASLTDEFIAACTHGAVNADLIMKLAPPELESIIRDAHAEIRGNWQRIVELCAKTFCLQHMDVFVFKHLHGTVELSVLSKRPQVVRLFCLLYDDGFGDADRSRAMQKALKLPESQVAHNAASVKTARDFVKQCSNRDDRKKTRA